MALSGLRMGLAALAVCLTMLTSPTARALELLQAAYIPDSTTYEHGFRSIPAIPVTNTPGDPDWSRWAMLHNGQNYRLYVFQQGSRSRIYQFGFNRATESYEWGYKSIPVVRLHGTPRTASTRSFAMLHDGSVYRLYLQDRSDPTLLHQFGFNDSSQNYEYGHRSIPQLRVTGFPRDTDWGRWAMLHDGQDYRFYAFRDGSGSEVYQAAYDPRDERYKFGYRSIRVLSMLGFPGYANRSSMAMLHDGVDFRLYFKDR